MNPLNKRFQVKIANHSDWQNQTGESPLSKSPNRWLSDQPVYLNRPGHGRRSENIHIHDIELLVGFVVPNTTTYQHIVEAPYGEGVFAIIEVLYPHIEDVDSLINTPAGLDITIDPKRNQIVSLNLVVDNPIGKVIDYVE